MSLIAIPVTIMAGITLYVGINHLFMYLKRKSNPENLFFSLTCLAMCLYDIFTTGLYNSISFSEGINWQRGQIVTASLVGLALMWFIISYTKKIYRGAAYFLTFYISVSSLFIALDRSPYTLKDIPSIKTISMPLMSHIKIFEAETGIITDIHYMMGIVTFIIIFLIVINFYREGNAKKTRPLIISLSFFFIGVVNDICISSGLYNFIYTIEYAYLAIVILMTSSMSNEILQSLNIKTALEESEEKYRNMVELSPYPIAIVNSENQFEYINPQFETIFGYKLDEIPDLETWFSLAYPDEEYRRDVKRSWNSVIQKTYKTRLGKRDFFVTCKDGSNRDIMFRLFKMEDGSHFIIFDDITDRKRHLHELLESKEDYRLIYENASEAIYSLDTNFRITSVSPYIESILGYTPEELIGRTIKEMNILSEASFTAAENDARDAFNGKMVKASEYTLITKQGEIKQVEASHAPLVKNDKIIGLVSIARDITERKKMEEELLKASKIESLGVFAGGIAHDFNNLLTAITGNISLAKINMKEDNETFEILNEAEKASSRAKDLTLQLLTFSRGGMPIKKATIINNLLRDTASFVLRGSTIKCDFHIPDDLWNAEIDEGQISQVVHNLVLNSRQAMSESGIISISAENTVISAGEDRACKPGNYVKISIEDRGCGIPSDVIPNIFDPYFTTKTNGNGLGLSVSYSIVKNHGGHIEVESTPGKGTLFYVYIPASLEMIDTVDVMPAGDRHRGGTVLLMDDEEIVLNVGERMLTRMGFTVKRAKNGEEAIEIYKESLDQGEKIDLVIMDLTIPGHMGGRETISKLRKIDPDVRAIVSSGYSNDPVMANYEDFGFIGVIAKPYRFEEVRTILNNINL